MRTVLGVRDYAPIGELHLFELTAAHLERAIELLRLRDRLTCTELVSQRPIDDGYIAGLRFERSPAGAGSGTAGDDTADGAIARIREFVERERARNAEAHLRACYGNMAWEDVRRHAVLNFVDFPAFDSGNVGIGFGLMAEPSIGPRYLWSRAVLHHK